jgi:hypothetical protein
VRDVLWTPPGGTPRNVPACERDAERVEHGRDPDTRQIRYGGQLVPYYYAPPFFGGYFGGFLPGLVAGELLGNPFGWGGPWLPHAGAWGAMNAGGQTGDPFATGDFGGGFSGGDLGGGGDFGGGGGDF